MAEIGAQLVTLNNIETALKQHSFDERAYEFYSAEKAARTDYDKLPNPGVETIVMYSTIVRTPKKYFFNLSPATKSKTEGSSFVIADTVIEGMGDGTVLATSSITPALKWASEYEKKVPGAKPITLAEICTSFRPRNYLHEKGNKKVNEYISVGCNCTPGYEAACDHLGVISDRRVVSFIVNSLQTRSRIADVSDIDSMDGYDAEDFADKCTLLESMP